MRPPTHRNGASHWHDGVPAALTVVAVHAALIGAATWGFTVSPRPANDITPPSITGVLVAEASQKLAEPAAAFPPNQPAPAVQPPPQPARAVQAPPTERSITVPEEPLEQAPEPETPEAEAPLDAAPRPVTVADAAEHNEAEAAPPVTPPMLDAAHLQNPAPVYPPEARRRREEGQVLLEVFIREDGSVGGLLVKRTSGHPALDRAALEAVQRWRFVPARRGSEAIPYSYELPVEFSLRR